MSTLTRRRAVAMTRARRRSVASCAGGFVIRADVRPSSVRAYRCADAREATDVRADADERRYPASFRCAAARRQGGGERRVLTIWVRVVHPSLIKIVCTWLSAVRAETTS